MCLSVLQDIVAQADETPTTLYVSEEMTSGVCLSVCLPPFHHPLFLLFSPFSLFPSFPSTSMSSSLILSSSFSPFPSPLSSLISSSPPPLPIPSSPFSFLSLPYLCLSPISSFFNLPFSFTIFPFPLFPLYSLKVV